MEKREIDRPGLEFPKINLDHALDRHARCYKFALFALTRLRIAILSMFLLYIVLVIVLVRKQSVLT